MNNFFKKTFRLDSGCPPCPAMLILELWNKTFITRGQAGVREHRKTWLSYVRAKKTISGAVIEGLNNKANFFLWLKLPPLTSSEHPIMETAMEFVVKSQREIPKRV